MSGVAPPLPHSSQLCTARRGQRVPAELESGGLAGRIRADKAMPRRCWYTPGPDTEG